MDVHFSSSLGGGAAGPDLGTSSTPAASAAAAGLDKHHGSDLDGMKALMRFNNYKGDEVRRGCARCKDCSFFLSEGGRSQEHAFVTYKGEMR